MAARSPETDFVKAGSVDGCARCTRSCPACPVIAFSASFKLQTGEFGEKAKVYVVGGTAELSSNRSQGLRDGTFIFNSVRGGGELPINKFVSNEMKTSEKTCSVCKESVSTCPHPETSKR